MGAGASFAAAAKIAICSEKQRLTEELREAVHHLMRLHDEQGRSLANGGDGLQRFDLALRLARKKRDAARTHYELHLLTHGC